MSDSLHSEFCEQCGSEVRGEICPCANLEYDEHFDTNTNGENAMRCLLLAFGIGLFSIAYLGVGSTSSESWITNAGTYFLIIAAYSFYLGILNVLAALNILTNEQVKKLDLVRVIKNIRKNILR